MRYLLAHVLHAIHVRFKPLTSLYNAHYRQAPVYARFLLCVPASGDWKLKCLKSSGLK